MGVHDMSVADTGPEDQTEYPGPFTVPAGWQGDAEQYRTFIRSRFAKDPGARQLMLCQSRWLKRWYGTVRYIGPYATVAAEILWAPP